MPSANAAWDFGGAQVLVTGGSNGIGLATANAFADAGAQVTITGRHANPHDYAHDLSRFDYHQLEVVDDAAIDALPKKLNQLDILINNAGDSSPGGTDQWDPSNFETALKVNIASIFRLSNACLPLLRESKLESGAAVIGIASLTSYFGFPLTPGYGAAKAGLVALTKTLAAQWGRHAIRVNAVAAGTIETNMGGSTGLQQEFSFHKTFRGRTPLKRLGRPNDVSDPILFLCSNAARYITGTTLMVDGGFSSTMWSEEDSDEMIALT